MILLLRRITFKTKICVNVSIPLDGIMQSKNETLFGYYWPLTLGTKKEWWSTKETINND